MENNEAVRKHYDENPRHEWERMTRHPFEFEINMRFLKRYLRPGQCVLDVGGGPGRYRLALAELGCDVTLVDLSPENVRFAKAKAQELGLPLRAFAGDARSLACVAGETFDHVLCMGPLYHLLDESDRTHAVEECLSHLRSGGTFAAAYITLVSGIIYMGREAPEMLTDPKELAPLEAFLRDENWSGQSFTQAFFINPKNVLPFMEQFPLEKLHYLASDPIVCTFEDRILACGPEVTAAWMDLAETVCEQERFWNFTEHLLYIGRRI